jgi:Tol biopolymer transport system component/DNA-binding winged helix-turn-helix (wHTH) protein
MNHQIGLPKKALSIDLATEPDFTLGAITVQPSLRRVASPENQEIVEPRIMQVLVTLARAKGSVVSRDTLTDNCWGGRIVGDDSINRCMYKIRQFAKMSGRQSFAVETIPRVGYRLTVNLENSELPVTPVRSEPGPTQSGLCQVGKDGGGKASNVETVARAGDGMHCETARGVASSNIPQALPRSAKRMRRLSSAAAAALVLGLAAFLYWSLRREPEWIVTESHLPLISTPAIERYPALSPDGAMIAYSAGPSINDRQIYLRLLNGGDSIQLTHEVGDASAPAWSPDSKIIAYVIFREGRPCRIMEVPVPTGQSRQVGQCRASDRSSLSFAPSGRALFFFDSAARGAATRIFRLNLDNGRISTVTHSNMAETSDGEPSVAPSGTEVLYSRYGSELGTEIRLLSLSDGGDRLLTAFDDGASATWSTDGSTIFVSHSGGNDNSLWAYPARGGRPWRILSSGEFLGRLSSGPNGLLAMEIQFPGGQLVAVTPHSDAPPRQIDSGGLKTWCVDYAADGTFLATGWHSERFGIWISGTNGSLRELLSLPDGPACTIRWSPDGTRFAFLQWAPHGFDAPVLTRAGAPIARLHFSGNDSGLLDWTADGKSILTSRKDKGGWRIWRTDLATPDKSVPITPMAGGARACMETCCLRKKPVRQAFGASTERRTALRMDRRPKPPTFITSPAIA